MPLLALRTIMSVQLNRIWRFPKRLRDHALGPGCPQHDLLGGYMHDNDSLD